MAAPRVYAFDTGFVCAARGWRELRPDDVGVLWEHFVLNEIHAHLQHRDVRYWRTKHGHELDFVLTVKGQPPIAIECKRTAEAFEPAHLLTFRDRYSGGRSFVVATDVRRPYSRRFGSTLVQFVDLAGLVEALVDEKALEAYHLLPSVRGDLLEKLGRLDEARAEFERAAGLARNARERTLLLERAAACR